MALEGGQAGDTRDGQGQEAGGQPRHDGPVDHTVPGTAGHQGSAASLDHPGATAAPVVSAPLGLAQRTGSRSRSFAYDTDVFQGENLTYAILTQPSQGWVTNNGDGTFSFDPGLDFRDLKPDESRRISFTYQVSDGWSGAETASASLTVTGTAEGTLAIEMAPGSTPRRAEAHGLGAPVDDAPQGDLPRDPSEPPAVELAGAVRDASDPGVAESRREVPAVPADDAEIGRHDLDDREPVAHAASGGEEDAPGPGGPFADEEPAGAEAAELAGSYTDGISTYPAIPPRDPEPAQTASPFGQAAETGGEDPLADGAPSFAAGPPLAHEGEARTAPDPDGALHGGSATWTMDATAPAVAPAAPTDDRSALDSHEEQSGPDPVGPEPGAGGHGQRFTILAQPPEGQVTVSGDGEFEFAPGPDFPRLEVGELHQVSFTCEATDGEDRTSIVIASLTVTGTSDVPEICDVSYRRAQGAGADQRPVAIADDAHSDALVHATAVDPGALSGSRPQITISCAVAATEDSRRLIPRTVSPCCSVASKTDRSDHSPPSRS